VSWVVGAAGEGEAEGSSPVCAIPAGTLHAVDPATGRAVCGADGLRIWPELGWPPAGGDVCAACQRTVS
jgi:hypothetical protein